MVQLKIRWLPHRQCVFFLKSGNFSVLIIISKHDFSNQGGALNEASFDCSLRKVLWFQILIKKQKTTIAVCNFFNAVLPPN